MMTIRPIALLWLLVLGSGHQATASTSTDACASLIPAVLRTTLEREFKNYRLPREGDSLPEDVAYAREHGSNGCLALAAADFDGDGSKDIALFMPSTLPKDVIVVAALSRGKGWRFEIVEKFDGEPLRWFIERAKPGRYVETEAWDYAAQDPRARQSFDSSRDGLFIGRTESAARAYFRSGGKWIYVQVSD